MFINNWINLEGKLYKRLYYQGFKLIRCSKLCVCKARGGGGGGDAGPFLTLREELPSPLYPRQLF